MNRFLIILVAAAMAGTASAQIIDTNFPQLTGDYETGWVSPDTAPWTRNTTFMFPSNVQSLDELRLVLSGTWTEGEIICSNPYGGPPDSTSFVPGLSMYLTTPDAPGDFFHATISPPSGEFSQWSATFESCCPSGSIDLNLLLGSEINIELFCDLVLILPCNVGTDSFGTLIEVRLQAFGTVPTGHSTWGALKSLYR